MIQESKWTTIFQATMPILEIPKDLTQKFLNSLSQEIDSIRQELGYDPDRAATDRLIWRLDNKDKVRQRMLDILPKYSLPDDDEFVYLLETIFYEGVESPLVTNMFTSVGFGSAAPLFFTAVTVPPDIDELSLEERIRYLTNNLHIEGKIPGLSRASLEQIFRRKGDYVIRGNLALFNADAFRAIGNWLGVIKAKLDAGEVFGFKRGRPIGTTEPEGDEKALETYCIYETYKGKQRKRRKGRSRWSSTYDEVRFEYQRRHGLPFQPVSESTVKYWVRKGRKIYKSSKANESQLNSA